MQPHKDTYFPCPIASTANSAAIQAQLNSVGSFAHKNRPFSRFSNVYFSVTGMPSSTSGEKAYTCSGSCSTAIFSLIPRTGAGRRCGVFQQPSLAVRFIRLTSFRPGRSRNIAYTLPACPVVCQLTQQIFC